MEKSTTALLRRYTHRHTEQKKDKYNFYTYDAPGDGGVGAVVVVRCYSDAVWEISVNEISAPCKARALKGVVKLAYPEERDTRRVLVLKVYKYEHQQDGKPYMYAEPFSFYAECGWGSTAALRKAVRSLPALASGDFCSSHEIAEIGRVNKHKEDRDLGKTFFYNNAFAVNGSHLTCSDGATAAQKVERGSQKYLRERRQEHLEAEQKAKKVARECVSVCTCTYNACTCSMLRASQMQASASCIVSTPHMHHSWLFQPVSCAPALPDRVAGRAAAADFGRPRPASFPPTPSAPLLAAVTRGAALLCLAG